VSAEVGEEIIADEHGRDAKAILKNIHAKKVMKTKKSGSEMNC
jgi:isopropylmalate/homocitrate/citramalate synthase